MTEPSDCGESRYSAALAGLGAILGVDRTGTRNEYLEDLRMAAALMRFDLEATKRELFHIVIAAQEEREEGMT